VATQQGHLFAILGVHSAPPCRTRALPVLAGDPRQRRRHADRERHPAV